MRPRLLAAYRETCYDVGGIGMRVGRRCAAMDRLLLAHGVRTGVLITAFNPLSRLMPPGWNRRMQASLRQTLWRRRVLPASGSLRRWSEAHLVVFGDVPPVQRLARRFRQCAVVVVRLRQPARLLLTFRGFGSADTSGRASAGSTAQVSR